MEDWAEIRRLHRAEGMPIRAIARQLRVGRNTVRIGPVTRSSRMISFNSAASRSRVRAGCQSPIGFPRNWMVASKASTITLKALRGSCDRSAAGGARRAAMVASSWVTRSGFEIALAHPAVRVSAAFTQQHCPILVLSHVSRLHSCIELDLLAVPLLLEHRLVDRQPHWRWRRRCR